MHQYDRRSVAFAVLLSVLAGYVDAMGFLGMGGFFVSFMSGNSTRLGVGLAGGPGKAAILAGGLIAMFVLGVMLGSIMGRVFSGRHRPRTVLLLVTVLLLLAGIGPVGAASTMALLAMAMGAENTIFERDREVSIGLTYMTGTLVRLGQHLTSALLGGPRWGWVRFLLLWAGLVSGTLLGALSHMSLGLSGIWFAAAAALALACAAGDPS